MTWRMFRVLVGILAFPAIFLLFLCMVFLPGCVTVDPSRYIEALSETDPPCAIKSFDHNGKHQKTRIECDR